MAMLQDLIGQRLLRVDAVHDYHQLHFGDYLLNVFNSIQLTESDRIAGAARIVAFVRETDAEVEIELTDGTKISVDMRPPSWKGPEALALYRGDELVAVWT